METFLYFVWLFIQIHMITTGLRDSTKLNCHSHDRTNCGLQPKFQIHNLNTSLTWEKIKPENLYTVEYTNYFDDSADSWKIHEGCNHTHKARCNLGVKLSPPDSTWCARISQVLLRKNLVDCNCACFSVTGAINKPMISYFAGTPDDVEAIYQREDSIKVSWESPATVYGDRADTWLKENYIVKWKWNNQSEKKIRVKEKSVVLTKEDSISPNIEYNITIQIVIEDTHIVGPETEPVTVYTGVPVNPLKTANLANGRPMVLSLSQWIKILSLLLGVIILIIIIWLLKRKIKEVKQVPYPSKEMIKSLYCVQPSNINYEPIDHEDIGYKETFDNKNVDAIIACTCGNCNTEITGPPANSTFLFLSGENSAIRNDEDENFGERDSLLRILPVEGIRATKEPFLLTANELEYNRLTDIFSTGTKPRTGFADTSATVKGKSGVNLNYKQKGDKTIDVGQLNLKNERETSL